MIGRGRKDSRDGEVLVVLMNNHEDWDRACREGWYRIPCDTAPRRWPPDRLAFYFTKQFGADAFSIRYAAQVTDIVAVRRSALFPDEAPNEKSDRFYYRITFEPPEPLPEPIPSYRLRRVVFIPTTSTKLELAREINDLYDESPLEDLLWCALTNLNVPAERQFHVKCAHCWYVLDFAIFCRDGKINVETDGDRWHGRKDRIPEDNERNNALGALGWTVLRFNTLQVREQTTSYCCKQIVKTMARLGGLDESAGPRSTYIATKSGIEQQLKLFEDSVPYDFD